MAHIGEILKTTRPGREYPVDTLAWATTTARRAMPSHAEASMSRATWEKVDPKVKRTILKPLGSWPLLFWGPGGTGKSSVAALLFMAADCPGWRPYWLNAADTIRGITSAWGTGEAKFGGYAGEMPADRMLEFIGRAGFLVLDDIGTRAATAPQQDAAYAIVCARMGKPTVYTSNLDPEGLAKVYDDRVVSRLCAGRVVEFTGKDRRMP